MPPQHTNMNKDRYRKIGAIVAAHLEQLEASDSDSNSDSDDSTI
jgi:hypothetical protein